MGGDDDHREGHGAGVDLVLRRGEAEVNIPPLTYLQVKPGRVKGRKARRSPIRVTR